MKLAKISHYRCNQPAGKWGLTTYVLIADDMTEQEFEALCESARKSYLDTEEGFKHEQPAPAPGYGATILPNTPDDMTVGQLKAEYETKAKAYKDYQMKVAEARKPFTAHLLKVSNGRIQMLWEPEVIKVELEWGHNHGTTIDYGETKNEDYPPHDEDEL